MKFEIGKELRALGVAEFVVLIFEVIIGNCIFNSELKVEGDDTLQFEAETGISYIRAFEPVRDSCQFVFNLLKLSIFVSILVLLHRDLQPCNDPSSIIPIYLAAVVIILNIILQVLHIPAVAWYFAPRFSPQEVQEKLEKLGKKVEGTMPKIVEKVTRWFPALERVFNTDSIERHKERFFAVLGILFVSVSLFVLAAIALSIYTLATMIKLAIPGDYDADCSPNDFTSRVVMLGLPILGVAHFTVSVLYIVTQRFRTKFHKGAEEIALVLWGVAFAIVSTVFTIILSVRSAKVWRGEDYTLYEYIAVAVGVPTISSLF